MVSKLSFKHLLNFKKTIFIVSFVLLVLCSSIPSFAAAAPTITLNPTSGPPGTVVQVTGSGYTPNGEIEASLWNGTSAYTFTADSYGYLSTTETVPTVDPGLYQFVVTDTTTQSSTTTQFTVTQSSLTSPTPTPSVPEFPIGVIITVTLLLIGTVMLGARKQINKQRCN